MSEVTIYSSDYCPFCIRAKQLLDSKKVRYTEIVVDGKPAVRAEMTRLAGGRTSGARRSGSTTPTWVAAIS